MTRYVVLSKREHAIRTWKRPDNYRFAERDQIVPLVVQETAAACCGMPFGFVRSGDSLELAALLSFTQGDNAYVAPGGRWMMRYVPLVLRGHPFHYARQSGFDAAILCVDEDSEFLKNGGTETFFCAGTLGDHRACRQAVRPVVGFLRIDKSALEKIDDATLLALRKVGALEIAYHQLASIHQIPTVERLSEIKEQAGASGNRALTKDELNAFLHNDRLIF